MLDPDERLILEALTRELSRELGIYRSLLELANSKRDCLTRHDLEALHRIIASEEEIAQAALEQRRIRDDLLRRLCLKRGREIRQMQFDELVAGLREPQATELLRLRQELRTVLGALAAINDGNQVMLRTALGLVRDILAGAAGVEAREGYDRSGRQGEQRGSGGLMNLRV